jgi:polar amino acid transport system substrate-binding protein
MPCPANWRADLAMIGAMRITAAIVLAIAALCGAARAQETASGAADKPLIIGTRVIAPFVLEREGKFTGFSIDLWQAISRELGRRSEFVAEPNVRALIDRVQEGKVDAAIAAISITAERERVIDFSLPMFDSGLQIMIRADAAGGTPIRNMWSFLSSPGFLELIAVLLVLVFVPLPIMWLVERPKGSQMIQANTRIGAFFKSIWWTTTTLIGQGADTPMSVAGRVVALLWMFVGLVFVSYFTGNVTAALTVQRLETDISSPDDLVRRTVVTVRGSTAAAFLEQRGIRFIEADRIEEAFQALQVRRAEAMVYDSPVLIYFSANEGRGLVQLAGPVFKPESYGIALPLGSPLRESVNQALLRLKESGEYNEIYRRWFRKSLDGSES